jgi:hypothetical protein
MHPDAVIPGSVPAELVLIRTGHVAVAVGSVRGYPNGFDFTLHVRVRGSRSAGGKLAVSIASRSRSPGSPCTEVIACSGIRASSRRSAVPRVISALDPANCPAGQPRATSVRRRRIVVVPRMATRCYEAAWASREPCSAVRLRLRGAAGVPVLSG